MPLSKTMHEDTEAKLRRIRDAIDTHFAVHGAHMANHYVQKRVEAAVDTIYSYQQQLLQLERTKNWPSRSMIYSHQLQERPVKKLALEGDWPKSFLSGIIEFRTLIQFCVSPETICRTILELNAHLSDFGTCVSEVKLSDLYVWMQILSHCRNTHTVYQKLGFFI